MIIIERSGERKKTKKKTLRIKEPTIILGDD